MFETLLATGFEMPAIGEKRYGGPERRADSGEQWRWLAAMLDEVDYGMLLLANEHRVAHVNHAARSELDARHPLQILDGELRARRMQDIAPLCEAVAAAARKGLRRMVMLGEDARRVSVAVVPLSSVGRPCRPTLLLFGRRSVCMDLSVDSFARSHRLTAAESSVLRALCEGRNPAEIATRQSVAISTVRTQISSIRSKTGASTIRHLVQQVATLPPLVGALRRS